MKTYEEGWNEAIEAVERRFREKPLSLMDICALKKPESMSDLTEDELTAVERTGDLPLGTASRLISEVRRLRKERVTVTQYFRKEDLAEKICSESNSYDKLKHIFDDIFPKPHVHEWSRTMLQPPFDNVSKFGCSCGATRVEQITEPK